MNVINCCCCDEHRGSDGSDPMTISPKGKGMLIK